MQKLIALMAILLFVSACNTPASRDPASQYYEIPLATKISLLKPVTIPANTAHIFFQGGAVTTPKETNQYHAFCRFEVRKISKTIQSIKPDTYTLKRIRSDFDVVSMPDLRLYYTKFWLSSAKDTNVLYLKCGQWSKPDDMSTYLTIKQMQDTVGNYMRIELPAMINSK